MGYPRTSHVSVVGERNMRFYFRLRRNLKRDLRFSLGGVERAIEPRGFGCAVLARRRPGGKAMECYCEKYCEPITAAKIACPHPKEYCKFRSACLVYFLEREAESEVQGKTGEDAGCGESGRETPKKKD